ncbi:MAG: phosphoserine transaminase [Pseudomonadota bacterium]
MALAVMPAQKPAQPSFSSGPCPKRPGWTLESVAERALLGRSHRAKGPKAQLKEAIEKTKQVLGLPEGYLVGIVPASDTGAVEMAMWSMLGARHVDMLTWESFGAGWVTDAVKQLKLADCNVLEAPYGELPDLSAARPDADLLFNWNGTTSGARVANADWIVDNPERIVICDATSAAFAQDIDWAKIDVGTFSWQKVLGGEAAHGVLILSPRAVARLESYKPDRPLPKIFRLTKGGKLNASIFEGATINTPSMLAVADYLDALDWAAGLGGLEALIARADANTAALMAWVEATPWVAPLVSDPTSRSNTSVCLKIVDPQVAALEEGERRKFSKKLVTLLEEQEAAFDVDAYRDAPPGLRIWCGATVETQDIRLLTPWLDWAFAQAKAERFSAAA